MRSETPQGNAEARSWDDRGERRVGATLHAAARRVRAGEEHADDDAARALARRMAIRAAAAPGRTAHRRQWALAAALIVLVCGGVALAIGVTRWQRMEQGGEPTGGTHPRFDGFLVVRGGVARPGGIGAPLRAPATEALTLRFDGRGRLTLAPGAEVRVLTASATERWVRLERGTLSVAIPPGGRARWFLTAGVHQVAVTGTAFTLRYAPGTRPQLDVDLARGAVLVRGPGLPAAGRRVAAGERLRLTAEERRWSADLASRTIHGDAKATREPHRMAPMDSSSPRSVTPMPKDAVTALAPRHAEGRPRPAESSEATLETRWGSWYDAGKHRDVVADARHRGLPGRLQTLTARALWLLAQAARYAGEPHLALGVLSALRQLHGADPRSRQVRYLMARIHQDQLGDAGGACQLYEQYLREQPRGLLHEEALGRQVVACRAAGKHAAARYAARRYLQTYPRGVFADHARKALGLPSGPGAARTP